MPAIAHVRLARRWLKFDLFLCVIVAINALAALWLLRSMEPGTLEATRAVLEGSLSAVLAALGITADVLLLRRKRVGIWFALGALLVTLTGIVSSIWLANQTLAQQAENGCDPETVIAGVMVGISLRLSLNLLYALAVVTMARALKTPTDTGA